MTNYYEILQVKNFAEDEVVRASYKALSKKYHPDVSSEINTEMMAEINCAFDILSNPEKKSDYDQMLHTYLTSQTENEKKNHYDKADRTSQRMDKENNFPIFGFLIGGVRIGISLIVAFIAGYLGNLLLMGFLEIDGSWSFLLYVVYGALIGSLIKLISGNDSDLLGIIGGGVCIITLVLPYYEFLYETIPIYNPALEDTALVMEVFKELWSYFFENGIVRAAAIILTPIVACSAISE